MTESDLDTDTITPEVVPQNQLQILVKESGLEQSKDQFLLDKFKDHFKLAAEWAKKAKDIIVTDDSQTVVMKQAKVARLFLREKRLEIENIRKILKADALKEGQAIDRLSNFLKDLIIPTEEHLERQEKFIEFREKAKEDALRIEVEKRMEEERIAKEKLDLEEKDRLRIENEKLKTEVRQIKQTVMIKEAEKEKEKIILEVGSDLEKLIIFKNSVIAIKIPEMKSIENKRIIKEAENHLYLAISKIKVEEEE